jgi:2-haloacid dehalogenase
MRVRAIVFDAYGTLFDVYSLVRCLDGAVVGDLKSLAALWRQKQLESTWLRALMERYQDFWEVTREALRSALRELQIQADAEQVAALMNAYLHPPLYPDVKAALESLKTVVPLAILSNGTPDMLRSAISHNDLVQMFAEIISVDRERTYKPSPRVYGLGPKILSIPADNILFVSSNWWDVAGAKSFGYKVCWCNRTGVERQFFDAAPDTVVKSLNFMAELFARLSGDPPA